VALFKRFPTLNPLPAREQHLVPPDERSPYPSLMSDFETLDALLMPVFRELDKETLRQQNRYRWMYIVLIFGGTLATILGVIQLAFSTLSWPGFAGAIVAAILAVTTTVSRTFKHHEHYLNARLASERLRGEYFLFLGHCPPYENDQDRIQHLRQIVTELQIKGEHDE
jgi:Protein of unknown function (DUF4231)